MLTIIHEDSHGKKTKWVATGNKKDMEVITAFFGMGNPIKPRNPWGPKGMPDDIKRQRLVDQLTAMESGKVAS